MQSQNRGASPAFGGSAVIRPNPEERAYRAHVERGSHQLQRLETRVAVLADDEVVVHGDAERARDLDDRPCHVDIGARGSGVAGGMVVQKRPREISK